MRIMPWCACAGCYAEWISQHPEALGTVIPLLLQGLHSADLAPSATFALKDVVRENQEHLWPFVAGILEASKRCLEHGHLKVRRINCRRGDVSH